MNTTAEPQVQTLWDRVHTWIRWFRIGASAIAGLFVLVLVLEAARLFQLAYGVHPTLGYVVIAALLALAVVIAIPI